MIGHELNLELVETRRTPSSGVAVHHPSKFEYAVLIYAYNAKKEVGSINELHLASHTSFTACFSQQRN